jgi:NAD+ diphosphatase
MAIVSEANDRILLGHNVRLRPDNSTSSMPGGCSYPLQKKFPGNFYSTLAGFIEPGESFEDAVKREILEEAGIHVWNVRYHSTQPWVRNLLPSTARTQI